MDYIAGGELFTYLRTEGKLDHEHAMMYSAQVCLMFEYLHSKNIIYRDLKPENILFDDKYHIKICDFSHSQWMSLVFSNDYINSYFELSRRTLYHLSLRRLPMVPPKVPMKECESPARLRDLLVPTREGH